MKLTFSLALAITLMLAVPFLMPTNVADETKKSSLENLNLALDKSIKVDEDILKADVALLKSLAANDEKGFTTITKWIGAIDKDHRESAVRDVWLAARTGPNAIEPGERLTPRIIAKTIPTLIPLMITSEPEGAAVYVFEETAPRDNTNTKLPLWLNSSKPKVTLKLKGYQESVTTPDIPTRNGKPYHVVLVKQ